MGEHEILIVIVNGEIALFTDDRPKVVNYAREQVKEGKEDVKVITVSATEIGYMHNLKWAQQQLVKGIDECHNLSVGDVFY